MTDDTGSKRDVDPPVDQLTDKLLKHGWAGTRTMLQHRQNEMEIQRLRALLTRMEWRHSETYPAIYAPILIIDEDGELDIGELRNACPENPHVHFHYRRGVCANVTWWSYVADLLSIYPIPDNRRAS